METKPKGLTAVALASQQQQKQQQQQAAISSVIHKDWEDREVIEIIQLNVLAITQFLNKFDMTVRYKLSTLNEKLNRLERSLQYCEAACLTSLDPPDETEIELFHEDDDVPDDDSKA